MKTGLKFIYFMNLISIPILLFFENVFALGFVETFSFRIPSKF